MTKKEIQELIREAADAGARAAVGCCQRDSTDFYRATERILFNYRRIRSLVADQEKYLEIEYHHRSKSITSALNSGGSFKDADDIESDLVMARRKSYERTRARFDEIDAVIRQFENRREFDVIRMYYFGESIDDKEHKTQNSYTFEEIAGELNCTEKTARNWRTRIIKDMATVLFGTEGALSVETR